MEHIHFIGIGGISMSGIACLLRSRGYTITGSDRTESDTTRELREAGIPVCIGQKAENITDDMDTIVYTAAIHEDNPELIAARKLAERKPGTRVIERAVMLGEILDAYEVPVAVSGTHGKTSTSSMLASIYLADGKDITYQIGGMLHDTARNYRLGTDGHMIIEACEYHDNFLYFHPKYCVITNIDAEHLDYFGTYENLQRHFHQYAAGMKQGGALITSVQLKKMFGDIPTRVISVDVNGPADVYASNIEQHTKALGYSFHIVEGGKDLGSVDLYLPGRHMVYDALCAAALALADGVPFSSVQKGLAAYRTTKKRFEFLGTYHGCDIVDDYAHHPTEIRAQLTAAKELPYRELYVVFQPHTYSRTKMFFDDFVDALAIADHIYLAPIYAARETDTGEVSSDMLAASLREKGKDARSYILFDEIEKDLKKKISTGCLLITMGAGNAVTVAHDLLSEK